MLAMIITVNGATYCQDPEDHNLGCAMCTSTALVITEDYPKDYNLLECGNPYKPVFFMGVTFQFFR